MPTRKVTSLPVIEKTVCTTNADQVRTPIDRIIIHTMVGTSDSADHRFNDCSSKVSAHYGVLLTGEVWHWVDEDWVAYHAGDYAMNQRSIAIEHEDNGDYNGVRPDVLYTASAKLVADICKFYEIPCDREHILKHSEIINTQCPDALDVDKIVSEASTLLIPPTPTVTDQSTYDFGGDIGMIELQAAKSKFVAMEAKDKEYLQTIGDQAKQIEDLKAQGTTTTTVTKIVYQSETFPQFLRRVLGIK